METQTALQGVLDGLDHAEGTVLAVFRLEGAGSLVALVDLVIQGVHCPAHLIGIGRIGYDAVLIEDPDGVHFRDGPHVGHDLLDVLLAEPAHLHDDGVHHRGRHDGGLGHGLLDGLLFPVLFGQVGGSAQGNAQDESDEQVDPDSKVAGQHFISSPVKNCSGI
jgi:hypothetical protein